MAMNRESNPLSLAIREARKSLGWTQEDLASRAAFSRSHIASIEGGTVPNARALERILSAFPDRIIELLKDNSQIHSILSPAEDVAERGLLANGETEDMIRKIMNLRRSRQVDISGMWQAIWLTTIHGEENRNREIVHVQQRWNGSWQFANEEISEDNPEGGYLWIARLELFDNQHILGYYIARDPTISTKGTLCLELQPNGREILGVWDGRNFDTMWAAGMVAMCRIDGNTRDPNQVLDAFMRSRPKMPF